MAKTFHEYDWPANTTIHWVATKGELAEKANTSDVEREVTCSGCLAYLRRERRKATSN